MPRRAHAEPRHNKISYGLTSVGKKAIPQLRLVGFSDMRRIPDCFYAVGSDVPPWLRPKKKKK